MSGSSPEEGELLEIEQRERHQNREIFDFEELISIKHGSLLIKDSFQYCFEKPAANGDELWRCTQKRLKCKARIRITTNWRQVGIVRIKQGFFTHSVHNHETAQYAYSADVILNFKNKTINKS